MIKSSRSGLFHIYVETHSKILLSPRPTTNIQTNGREMKSTALATSQCGSFWRTDARIRWMARRRSFSDVIANIINWVRRSIGRTVISHQHQAGPSRPANISSSTVGKAPNLCTIRIWWMCNRDENQSSASCRTRLCRPKTAAKTNYFMT